MQPLYSTLSGRWALTLAASDRRYPSSPIRLIFEREPNRGRCPSMNAILPTKCALDDEGSPFETLFLKPAQPRASVLFAVGGGGDPERHLSLLQALAAHGCAVIAPRFVRLTSAAPDADMLEMRARRSQLAFNKLAQPDLPAAGVGHSIGATILLMLAGAAASTIAQETVRVPPEQRLKRLALMAPATDFFRAPGALLRVTAQIGVWAGTRDEITPPRMAQMLENNLHGIVPVQVRVVAEAGHFSFMNVPPPDALESLPDRDLVLKRLAEEVAEFVTVD